MGDRSPPVGSGAGFATLLAAAMALSVFSIPTFGVLSSFLLEDLEISRSQFGWLVTSVSLTTAVTSPFAGRVVDAIGGRTVLLGVFALTAVSAGLVAVAPAYPVLIAVAVLAGVPNGANNPATNKLIITHVPVGRRGVIMGIKQSGVQAGIFLFSISMPVLAVAVGWRWAVASVAGAAAVGLAVARSRIPADLPSSAPRRAGFAAARTPGVRWLAAYAFLMGAGSGAITSFLPLYAQEAVGFTPAAAGFAASLIGLLGVGARIAIGHRVEGARRYAPPLGAIAVGAAAASLAMLFADRLPPLLWLGVLVAGLTVASWNAVAMLAAVAISRQEDAGEATGLVVLGFMGGFTSSPVAFGWTVDATDSYFTGWAAVATSFVLAGILTAFWRGRDADRPREAAPELSS